MHDSSLNRTNSHTEPAPVTGISVVNHPLILPYARSKNTAFNTISAVQTSVFICLRNVFRMGDQVTPPVFPEKLKVVAAARTATADCKNMLIRIVQTEMHQSFFIGLTQHVLSRLDRNATGFSLSQVFIRLIIYYETNI